MTTSPMTSAGRAGIAHLLDAVSAWDGARPNDFAQPRPNVQQLLDVVPRL